MHRQILAAAFTGLALMPSLVTAVESPLARKLLKQLKPQGLTAKAKRREKIKLRTGERAQMEAWTQPERSYKSQADSLDGLSAKDKRRKKTKVQYRGTLVEVLHGGRRAAVWSSDPTIAQYLDKDSDRGLASTLPDLGGK